MALYLSPRGIWRCIRRKGLLILRDVAFALVLYLLTFVFILPQNMRNVRFSPYFIEPENITDILVEQNEQRVKYAQEFLKGFTATRKEMSGPSDSKKDKEYLYSIGIITQERNNNKAKKKPFYLTQVAARFLEILHGPNGGYSDRTKIFICNVDPNTSGVKEVNTLSEHLEIVNRFSPDSINKGETDAYEKEKMDYIFCLQETLKHSSKYVILIEDDVLPIRKLLDMLTYFLETKINVRWSHGYPVNTADSWLAFKLYYPERWQGYSKTVKDIIELASFGIIVGSLLTFIYVSFLHRAGNI
ncbi:transmembrane protein 246 [Lingula anatina]|uniref:Transmembrane protein 246 n=1 Tax=Lingula anatina TaxID=7574 RepID=A0A1S3JZ95_LINAN|nr:transmembrane protein 246 [Lingula anatina]|eukprot:XP_013415720.1 transmembrane protein 246 [Lingula anatina]